MIEDYQVYNNPNNQFLLFLLDLINWQIKQGNAWRVKDESFVLPKEIDKYKLDINDYIHDSKVVNKFFNNHHLDIQFTQGKEWPDANRIVNIRIGKLPFIDDKLMAEILQILVKSGQSFNGLNKIIYDKGLPFLLADIGKMGKQNIIVMYSGKFL